MAEPTSRFAPQRSRFGAAQGRFAVPAQPRSAATATAAAPAEREPERTLDDDGLDSWTIAQAILAEQVKIAGVKRDADGRWSWAPENVVEYFKEEPVWATLDAVTLAFPAAKWGAGALKVAKGTTAAGRAYKAGKIGMREAVKLQARNAISTSSVGRFFSNPITRGRFDDEYVAVMKEFGQSPAETRALADIAKREYVATAGYWRGRTADVTAALSRAGIPEADHPTFIRSLENAVEPADFARAAQVEKLMTPSAADAYERVWKFRADLGFRAENVKMLRPERAMSQSSWMPHIIKQEYGKALKRHGYKSSGLDIVDEASWDSFMHRKHTTEKFESLYDRDFDPVHSVVRMGQAAQAVAREEYAQKLIGSAVVKDGREVVDHVLNNVLGNPKMQKLWSISDETAAALQQDVTKLLSRATEAGSIVQEDLARVLDKVGWVRLGDVSPGLKLPEKYAGLFVDKKVADDLVGVFKMTDEGNLLGHAYDDAMAFFRASKTAYNPATWVRNAFGAMIFHHFAVGGTGMLGNKGFTRGLKLWSEGFDNPLFRKFAEAGMANATYDAELRAAWREAFKHENRISALDFIGNGKIRDKIKAVAGSLENGYKALDEITRLDAGAVLYEKFKRLHAGKWADDVLDQKAIEFATLEVAKYIPSFSMHSPLSNMVRRHIPFASFSHEAVRVWKNVLSNKPHLGFFWLHFADTAGQALGAMAGYTPEEIAEAKANLSPYQKDKQMMMWPFQVDGKPVFLDMSYLIPFANVVDVEREESSFLGTAAGMVGMNPTTNPFWNLITAASTGLDPFRKLPVEPKVTERALGIPVEGTRARAAVGLAEHAAATFLPPVVPPGYAGINLLEYARNQKHHITGAPLEDGFWRTIGSNLLGARLHEADVNAALLDVARTDRLQNEKSAQWRERWKFAAANGDARAMESAEENLVSIQVARGKSREEAEEYVADFVEKNFPGELKTLPRAQVEEAMRRSRTIGLGSDPDDAKLMAAMAARTRSIRRRSRSRRGRTRSRTRSR